MSDKAQAMLQSMLDDMARVFPGFRIVPKRDDRLSRIIHVALRIVRARNLDDGLLCTHNEGWEA
jgi:hypothetical protein